MNEIKMLEQYFYTSQRDSIVSVIKVNHTPALSTQLKINDIAFDDPDGEQYANESAPETINIANNDLSYYDPDFYPIYSWEAVLNYNVRWIFHFQKTNLSFMLYIPLALKASPVSATLRESAIATLYGPAIGSIVQLPPAINMTTSGPTPSVNGNANGGILEQRTLIKTSDFKTLIKAGLKAEVYEVGSEISAGSTVTSSLNMTRVFNYNINFHIRCDENLAVWNQIPPTYNYGGIVTMSII